MSELDAKKEAEEFVDEYSKEYKIDLTEASRMFAVACYLKGASRGFNFGITKLKKALKVVEILESKIIELESTNKEDNNLTIKR